MLTPHLPVGWTGRPTAQWSRIKDGRNDDLGATSRGHSGQHGH